MTSTIDPLTDGAAERPSWFRANLEGEFGPNDWFVEEKYQEFLADPGQVDPIWRDFFTQGAPGHPVTDHTPPREPAPVSRLARRIYRPP